MHPAKVYVLFCGLFGASFGFISTVYVPFLLSIGLSLADVALINVAYWLTVSAAELPTGMWADGRGRAWSIRTGTLLLGLSFIGYALARGFASAMVCEMAGAVGTAFLSGAQQAWITDALKKRGEGDSLGRVFGAAALWRSLGLLGGGLVGAVVGAADLRLSIAAAGAFMLIALGVAARRLNGDGEPETRMTEKQAFCASAAALRRDRGLLWSVAVLTAFGLVLPFNLYWTVFFREGFGQAWLGLVWLPIYSANAAAGWIVRKWNVAAGRETAGVILAVTLTGAGLAGAGLAAGVAVPFLWALGHEIGRGLFDPLLDTYTQRRIESPYRATFGSFQSLIGRAGFGIVLIGTWLLTRGRTPDASTVRLTWVAAGLLLSAAAAVFWLFRPRRRPETGS